MFGTEDYQGNGSLPGGLDQSGMDGLLGALGATSNPAPEDNTPPADSEGTPATPATPVAESGNPIVDADGNPVINTDPEGATPPEDTVTPPVDPNEAKRNNAFAEMRAANAQYKKFLNHLMKGSKFQGTEEQFIEHLTDVSYQQQAKDPSIGANPELLKRLDNLESTNNQLMEQQNRNMFADNIRNLTTKFSLNETEVREFIQKAVDEKIDLTVPGTNFATLYQGLFFDKIKDKLIENERQEWIKNNTKANSATNPDGKSGKKDPSPTNVNTMAEFESLLQNLNPKK